MSFKEMLEGDLAVFFDADTLADKLIINDIEVIGILSEDKFNPSKNDSYGVFTAYKKLALSSKDWEKLKSPSFGYTLNFDNCNYKVRGLNDKAGVIELRLEGDLT